MTEPWKILIYIAADNRLFNDAMVSLRQITQATGHGKAEVLVQFDGPGQDTAARFLVKGGRKQVIWEAARDYTADRGQRLEDFLHYASGFVGVGESGPPILFVLWGHGAGIDHVYVYEKATVMKVEHSSSELRLQPSAAPRVKDLLNAEDANLYVKNIDLAEILRSFKDIIRRKIDILGLDACLMGLAEITHEIRESVSLMVASDEDIPSASWPYDKILPCLETYPVPDGQALAKNIVDKYVDASSPATDTTRRSLAIYDLSGCDGFAAEFKSLVRALLGELVEETTRDRIVRAREFSRTDSEPVYIDLFVFVTELAESFDASHPVHQRAEIVRRLLDGTGYILHTCSNPVDQRLDSRGLALYFPVNLAAEQVAAATPTSYPIQPVKPDALPTPQATGVKTPPRNPDKNVVFPGGATLPILSYQVLWEDYVKLAFNKDTGWSSLVRAFLPYIPKPNSNPTADRKMA